VRGQVQGGNRPKLGHVTVSAVKTIFKERSLLSTITLQIRPLMKTNGNLSKRAVTQNVAPQSHLRGICCFQQHHADQSDALCYQGHLRSPAARRFMQKCHACNRQFGLIRHRWWGYHFCKKKCLNDFLAKRSQQIGRMKDWLSSSEAPAREPSRL
jgi:hypothetical protein